MTRKERSEETQNEIFKEQKKESLRHTLKLVFIGTIIFAIACAIFFTYTTFISTSKIGVREYRIVNEKLPDSLNGLKIIHISDLHYGSTMFMDNVKKVIDLSNQRNPDIVIFTGDLINKDYKLKNKEQEELINQLQQINVTLGKYAVEGDEDKEIFTTIMNQSGFSILKNEYDLIYNDTNNPILLTGLGSKLNDNLKIDDAFAYFKEETHNADIYTIAMFHEPDSTDDILNTYSPDLLLAGHSHNGNIRLPIINKALFKKPGAKKYDQDYYSINKSSLYISSGLGTNNKSGIRLFCRPSINFYRISQK